MKNSVLMAIAVAACVPAMVSCSGVGSLSQVSSSAVGSVTTVVPGTVVGVRMVDIGASASAKGVGTALGGLAGLAGGAALGRGKGQLVTSIGGLAIGGALGHVVGSEADKSKGQELTIRADKDGTEYTVVQPIYKEVGAIAEGTHGKLHYGASSKFVPDGV